MKKTAALFLLVFSAAVLRADILETAGVIFPVLENGAGVRGTAMAGAFSAVADSADAAYWNPAGLGLVKLPMATAAYNKWLVDSFYSDLLVAIPAGPGAIGGDLFYMGYGPFKRVDEYGAEAGANMNPYTFSALVSYGLKLSNNFYAGASARIASQGIDKGTDTGFAGNIGVLFKAGAFSAGLTGRNLGAAGSFSLPMNIKGGMAVELGSLQENRFIIEADGAYEMQGGLDASIGAEFIMSNLLALRGGYRLPVAEDNLTGLKGFTAGAGLRLGYLEFDYAFVPYGELGTAHMMSVSYTFGAPQTPPPEFARKTPDKKGAKSAAELDAMFIEAGKLENSGKLDAAGDKYREIISEDPAYADAYKRLGAVYVKQNQKPMAIKTFETYLKLRPTDKAVAKWLEKNNDQW